MYVFQPWVFWQLELLQFKMQFQIIRVAASVLLFFVAQTIATPVPQAANDICTLPSTVLR